MATDHEFHPLMKTLIEARGFESASLDDVYKAEVSRFAMLPAHARAENLRDLDERVKKVETEERVNNRQKMQIHRYRSHLDHAHRTLRKAGR